MTNMNGSDGDSDDVNEQVRLAEVGRATARLIHDFKNQLGGLKLYAAYLKKRFAGNPDVAEGLEIADKIVQTINDMSENATLIGRLSRPVELKPTKTRFASLVEQAINQLRPQFEERRLKIETEIAETPPMQIDSQQMLSALSAMIVRSVEASAEGAKLRLKLQSSDARLMFSIFDEGKQLTEEQRQSLFAFLTNERMNKTSLNLTLARRIIEAHGGQIVALASEPSGLEIRITIGF